MGGNASNQDLRIEPMWPGQNEIRVLIHATALPCTGTLLATCAQESPTRVDHNRPPYRAFPAFKRGFDSGFAASPAQDAPPCRRKGAMKAVRFCCAVAERPSRAAMRARLMADLAGYRWPPPLASRKRRARSATHQRCVCCNGVQSSRLPATLPHNDHEDDRAGRNRRHPLASATATGPVPPRAHRCSATSWGCAGFRESGLPGTVTAKSPVPPWSVAPPGR